MTLAVMLSGIIVKAGVHSSEDRFSVYDIIDPIKLNISKARGYSISTRVAF